MANKRRTVDGGLKFEGNETCLPSCEEKKKRNAMWLRPEAIEEYALLVKALYNSDESVNGSLHETADNTVYKLEVEIELLKKEKDEATIEIHRLGQENESLKIQHEEYNSMKRKCNKLQQDVHSLKNQLKEEKTRVKKLHNDCDDVLITLENERKTHEEQINRLEREIENGNQRLLEANLEIQRAKEFVLSLKTNVSKNQLESALEKYNIRQDLDRTHKQTQDTFRVTTFKEKHMQKLTASFSKDTVQDSRNLAEGKYDESSDSEITDIEYFEQDIESIKRFSSQAEINATQSKALASRSKYMSSPLPQSGGVKKENQIIYNITAQKVDVISKSLIKTTSVTDCGSIAALEDCDEEPYVVSV